MPHAADTRSQDRVAAARRDCARAGLHALAVHSLVTTIFMHVINTGKGAKHFVGRQCAQISISARRRESYLRRHSALQQATQLLFSCRLKAIDIGARMPLSVILRLRAQLFRVMIFALSIHRGLRLVAPLRNTISFSAFPLLSVSFEPKCRRSGVERHGRRSHARHALIL